MESEALTSRAPSFRYPRIIQNEGSPTITSRAVPYAVLLGTATDGNDSPGTPNRRLGVSASGHSGAVGTSSTHVLEELLDAEVAVNVNKLCEASRQGVDPAFRSTVYRYLLGVAVADKSREMTMERELEKDFAHIVAAYDRLWISADADDDDGGGGVSVAEGRKGGGKRPPLPQGHYVKARESRSTPFIFLEDSPGANAVRSFARGTEESHAAWAEAASRLRHSEPYASDAARRQRLDATLRALQVCYSGASQFDISTILALLLPMDAIGAHARDVFFCLQSLYQLLTHHGNVLQDRRRLQHHCGNLLLLFRATNLPLYQHFFAEGVTTLEWVPDILATLLAGRLHHDDLLRLWDYYLADAFTALSIPLHPYVVLAILAELTEELIECEKSEILSRLRHLPRIDAASILQSAISIRESVFAKGLLPPSSQ